MQQITAFLEKYNANLHTDAEHEAFMKWLQSASTEEKENIAETYLHIISARDVQRSEDRALIHKIESALDAYEEAGIHRDLSLGTSTVHRIHFLRRSWLKYAAAVIIFLGGASAWYVLSDKTAKPGSSEAVMQAMHIQPGSNKAVLTIGNNKPIDLSNQKTGIVTERNAITYNDGERIADAGQMLTLSTPRGGQYQAVLPDGTKVWLNAASSIRFPSKFSGSKRDVEVSGEVYMEVAQNKKSPFSVITGKSTIQVLGTSFNINAYPEEEGQRMTLIDGSVQVSGSSSDPVILKPGYQAFVMSSGNSTILVRPANIEQTLAWKNGYFNFENVSLREMGRQIERWYDIRVVFQGDVSAIVLKGEMDRGVKLPDIMRFFNDCGFETILNNGVLTVKQK